MKVAVFSTRSYDREWLDASAQGSSHTFDYFETGLSPVTRTLAHGYAAVCLFVNDRADRATLEDLAAKGLKIIALRCAGFNNVDLPAARSLGIKVVRVPAYSPHAVAEHAVALIMTLNRKTHKAYNRVREGNFSLERLEGFDLYGKTVGVIGTGKIGSVFCRIMQGFGCQVLAHDSFPDATLAASGVSYVPIEELLEKSDIISLHCPLTPETRHIIHAGHLALMKPDAMLINTSRGALIDTPAVIEALKNRRLGYLGLDVYEQEESLFFRDLSETVIPDDTILRLMSFSNVLITAHQAFFTRNALSQIASTTIGSLIAFEQGEKLENEV